LTHNNKLERPNQLKTIDADKSKTTVTKKTIMKKNMGSIDKNLRIVIAVLVGVLYFTNVISGTLALVLGVLAVVFLLTSFLSFCPLYAIFNINTCKIKR